MQLVNRHYPARIYAAGCIGALIEKYGSATMRSAGDGPAWLLDGAGHEIAGNEDDGDWLRVVEWNGATLTVEVNGTRYALTVSVPRQTAGPVSGDA